MKRRTPPSRAATSMVKVAVAFARWDSTGSAAGRATLGTAASWYTTSMPRAARRAVSRSARLPRRKSTSSRTARRFGRRPPERSSSTRTRCPRPTSASARWLPMKPAPPVTRILSLLRRCLLLLTASEHIVADPPRARAPRPYRSHVPHTTACPLRVTTKGATDRYSRTVRRFLPMTAHEEPSPSPCSSAASDAGGRGVAEGAGGCNPGFHPPELTKTEEEDPLDSVPDSSHGPARLEIEPQERVYKPDPVPPLLSKRRWRSFL